VNEVANVCDCGKDHDETNDCEELDDLPPMPHEEASRKLRQSTTMASLTDKKEVHARDRARATLAKDEEVKVLAGMSKPQTHHTGQKKLNTKPTCENFFHARKAFAKEERLTKLPEDVELFRSVLRVHSYLLSQGTHPLVEATEPLCLHTWDREVVIVGLTGLISGSKVEFDDRSKDLARDTDFPVACKQAVLNFPEPDVFMPSLKITRGVMLANVERDGHPVDKSLYVETAAVAVRAALDVLVAALATNRKCWCTEETWGLFLETLDCALRQRNGQEILEEHDILNWMNQAWRTLEDSENDAHRLLVKNHKGGTEYVLEALGQESDEEEEEEESSLEDSEEDQGED
jgi:hypothetical protein